MTIVRSFQTGDSKHDVKPVVSTASAKTSLGAIYSRIAGETRPATGMTTAATSIRIRPRRAVRPAAGFGSLVDPGQLGTAYSPFVPGSGGEMQESMRLQLPRERLDDRRSLLKQLDGLSRRLDNSSMFDGVDRFREQAFQTILGGVADAFDLAKEDPRVVALRHQPAGTTRKREHEVDQPQTICQSWPNTRQADVARAPTVRGWLWLRHH